MSTSEGYNVSLLTYRAAVSLVTEIINYDDQNFYVTPHHNITVIELQTHAMNVLHQRGLPAQTALPTLTGKLMSLKEFDCGFDLQKYLVRLLTYLPGTTVAKITCSPQILYDVGKMAATLDTMEHPNISYQIQVVPKLPLFRKCINHGDFNDHNLLVNPDGPTKYKISGILDFGDMSCGYFIFELAITIMYMMIENPNPVDVGGPVVAGWESVFPLNEAERDLLYLLVLCRFCQSLVLARHAVIQQPEDEDYLMITARTGVRHLCRLWELGKEEVERIWFQSAAQFGQP
uniref:Hydroxylysine kinase n=1 Tax=Sinocyclocheilus grahami TaxID=75366 RepID=A0A672QQ09_SINGR